MIHMHGSCAQLRLTWKHSLIGSLDYTFLGFSIALMIRNPPNAMFEQKN